MPARHFLRNVLTIPGALLAMALAVGVTTAGEIRLLGASGDPAGAVQREHRATSEGHERSRAPGGDGQAHILSRAPARAIPGRDG